MVARAVGFLANGCNGRAAVRVSPLALIRDNTPCVGGVKEYSLTDDLALVIDGAVSRLISRDLQMGDFIWLYFGAKWPG